MHLSVSSILISILLASALIVIMQWMLSHRAAYKALRIDFLSIFAIIIGLRLFLPLEFINTHTISSHKVLPVIYAMGNQQLRTPTASITVLNIFKIIWLVGFVIGLMKLIYDFGQFHKVVINLEPVPNNYLAPSVAELIPEQVKLLYLPIRVSPFTLGVMQPKIVLPKIQLTPTEQENIIKHELCHIRSYDVLKRYIIELLVCIYWWLPLIYLFRSQVNQIIEMNVDYQMVKKGSKTEYSKYVHSLMSVASLIATQPQNSQFNFPQFTINEQPTLEDRIFFLLEGYNVRHTSLVFKVVLVLLPLLITSVIIEPEHYDRKDMEGTYSVIPSSHKNYILKKGDKYYLIVKGKNAGRLPNYTGAKDPKLKQLPVRSK